MQLTSACVRMQCAGSIGWGVYGDYCAYTGTLTCLVILASLIIGQGAYLGSEYWCVRPAPAPRRENHHKQG